MINAEAFCVEVNVPRTTWRAKRGERNARLDEYYKKNGCLKLPKCLALLVCAVMWSPGQLECSELRRPPLSPNNHPSKHRIPI